MLRFTRDESYMAIALMASLRSKDRSTQVGCCLVDQHDVVAGTGYNGMPRGVNDEIEARHERPLKYEWFAHAEENALNMSPRDMHGGVLYVSGLPPCPKCARMMVQRGVIRVVHWPINPLSKWAGPCKIAREMLTEVGIKVEVFQGDLSPLTGAAWRWLSELEAARVLEAKTP